MTEGLQQVVAKRRLTIGTASRRRRFTVEQRQALLQLRALPRPSPWSWTLDLVRAANVVSSRAWAQLEMGESSANRVVALSFSIPDAGLRWDTVDLLGLLQAALEPDVPRSIGADRTAASERAWRRCVARGLNAALATEPVAIELRTPGGTYEANRRDTATVNGDWYRERVAPDCSPADSFVVRIHHKGRRRWWPFGRGDEIEAIAELWRRWIPGLATGTTASPGLDLFRDPPGRPVHLGDHALWWWQPDAGALVLVRDRVRLVTLGDVLRQAGLDPRELAGVVDCPALRLTADERGIVHDRALRTLLAWLHEAHHRMFAGTDGVVEISWPSRIEQVAAASGRIVSVAEIGKRALVGDVLYVWPHEIDNVPIRLKPRVLRLSPSELALLRRAVPHASLVPLDALGQTPQIDDVELRSLEEASFSPVELDFGEPVVAGDTSMRGHLRAYVHRFATAARGSIVLLAYGRRIAYVGHPARVLPGVTLVFALDAAPDTGPSIDALRARSDVLNAVAQRCRQVAEMRLDDLLSHAIAGGNPWETPAVRASLDELDGVTLGLRYVATADPQVPIRLSWRDSPVLAVVVARTAEGRPKTILDALQRCRDVGGIVVIDDAGRWKTLESGRPEHEPWIVEKHAADLVRRVLGEGVLWPMPTVPEAHPHVDAVGHQAHLVLEEAEVHRLRRHGGTDTLARIALLAHAVLAAEHGRDSFGLEHEPLIRRYDPRALAPTKLVSLDWLRSEPRPPGLCFPGAVSRALETPVLEATPAEALLLHHEAGLQPAAPPKASVLRRSRAGEPVPVRRRGREPEPLVTLPIATRTFAGALRLDPGLAGKIAVWSKGLHLEDMRLDGPLAAVSGRLWLTATGMRAGRDVLVALVEREAIRLVEAAAADVSLLVPGSGPRVELERFLADVRNRAPAESSMVRARSHGLQGHEAESMADPRISIERDPPRPLPSARETWLTALVRQALRNPVFIETSWLSWTPVELASAEADRPLVLNLGKRNPWIGRGLRAEVDGEIFEAAALVIAEALDRARARGLPLAARGAEAVAFYRLLAIAFAVLSRATR